MESCFGKEKTGCKLKRQMIIYNEIYRKKLIGTIKSLKKQANMIIYWKLYCNNECVAQEGFQGSEGRFFYGT